MAHSPGSIATLGGYFIQFWPSEVLATTSVVIDLGIQQESVLAIKNVIVVPKITQYQAIESSESRKFFRCNRQGC